MLIFAVSAMEVEGEIKDGVCERCTAELPYELVV